MNKSFLSYGWCDAALISQFAANLEARGVPVFLDKWDLSSGRMVWSTIDKAIDDAEKLVLFLSRDALSGKGVKEEIDRGLQKAYEKQGETFIIPVALDKYDDIALLIPIRVRGANMIRAFDQQFDESVAQIVLAIRDEPIARKAISAPIDFYCRFHKYEDALMIEIGSGIQAQDGFSVEANWDIAVLFKEKVWGMNPPDTPEKLTGFKMIEAGSEQHLPKTSDTRFCVSLHNQTISRKASFYFAFATPGGKCPPEPSLVILKDKFRNVIRSPVEKVE